MLQGIGFGTNSMLMNRTFGLNNRKINDSLNKLASGLKIPSAKFDAAGLSIATKLTSISRGLETAQNNVGDGISMIQTAEGGMSQITSELQDIRALAVQANNDTLSSTEKSAIQAEIDQKLANIDSIADGTSFNGKNLLDGSSGNVSIQSGESDGDTTSVDMSGDMSSDAAAVAGTLNEGNTGGVAGEALNNIDVVSGNVDDIITGLDNAIANASAMTSDLGASQNALEAKYDHLDVKNEAVLSARSRILDTDFASETSNLVKSTILQNTTAALQSQSIMNSRLVLDLLP